MAEGQVISPVRSHLAEARVVISKRGSFFTPLPLRNMQHPEEMVLAMTRSLTSSYRGKLGTYPLSRVSDTKVQSTPAMRREVASPDVGRPEDGMVLPVA